MCCHADPQSSELRTQIILPATPHRLACAVFTAPSPLHDGDENGAKDTRGKQPHQDCDHAEAKPRSGSDTPSWQRESSISLSRTETADFSQLSSLAYLRSFFSEKVFDTQAYAAHERLPSYREYADGKLPDIPKGSTRPHTTMQVLRRGRSKRVDTFLDWLVMFPGCCETCLPPTY